MRTRIPLILLGMFLLAGSSLAQTISVQASVNTSTVGAEEVLRYQLTVQGASNNDVSRPEPPATEGLTLLQPNPSTQQSISIVNGQMERSMSYEWAYRPIGVGEARLSPATVVVAGKEYQTAPITVTVVPQDQRPAQQRGRRRAIDPFNPFNTPPPEPAEPLEVSERDIFIRVIPSARQVYRNQQLIVEYHLFFRDGMQLRQSRLADSWDAEGFWKEELDVERRPVPRAVVENGLRYNTIVLKRVAVFPTRTGSLRIDPLKIEAEAYVPRRSADPFDQLFSLRPRFEPVQVASAPLNVEVLGLPEGAPASFKGAVGSFTMEAEASRIDVEVGEPIEVKVNIAGSGNLATLDPPTFDSPGVFEEYDPEVNTLINRSGNRVRGRKTLTYVLVPRSNGTFELPPIELSYFNPSRRQYETARPSPIMVKVSGEAEAPVSAFVSSTGLPVDDIGGLLPDVASWQPTFVKPYHERFWVYFLLVLPLLAVVGVVFQQRFANRLASDQRFARNRRAHPVARRHLKQAEKLLQSNHPRSFYAEIERALLSFIGNRLNIPETGYTYSQLEARLQAAGLDDTLRSELKQLLQECDQVRFAPTLPDIGAMNTACDRASDLIVRLDEAFTELAKPSQS